MTRIIHKQAVQAHAVPKMVLEARGPFQKYEAHVVPMDIAPEFPPGATAQNGMREVILYKCNACGEIVKDFDTASHVCADVPTGISE